MRRFIHFSYPDSPRIFVTPWYGSRTETLPYQIDGNHVYPPPKQSFNQLQSSTTDNKPTIESNFSSGGGGVMTPLEYVATATKGGFEPFWAVSDEGIAVAISTSSKRVVSEWNNVIAKCLLWGLLRPDIGNHLHNLSRFDAARGLTRKHPYRSLWVQAIAFAQDKGDNASMERSRNLRSGELIREFGIDGDPIWNRTVGSSCVWPKWKVYDLAYL